MRKSRKVEREIGFLPDYDRAMYREAKSESKELKEAQYIKKSLEKALGCETDVKLDDGTIVKTSIADVIVAETLKDAIKNPNTSKLKDLANINGELKQSVDVNIQSAEELFGDIVNK